MSSDSWMVDIPEGSFGGWKVERFTISREQSAFAFFSYKGRAPGPGTYTRLIGPSGLWMSDTPAECRDHFEPLYQAGRRGGDVLVHGLGLGVLARKILLEANSVRSLTIIERERAVVRLVEPWLRGLDTHNRLRVVVADSLTWKPPRDVRYTVVWHDIWQNACEDNLEQMKFLHRRYGRRCDWQGSWSRAELKRSKRAYSTW